MSPGEAVVLFLAGLGGGLCGSIAGLASLVSYPTLLALGLDPVAANVTNTVSIVWSSIGSIIGSRPELVGQRAHVSRVSAVAVVGGAFGGALLLLTPAASFEKVVPWLLVLASASILIRRRVVSGSSMVRDAGASGSISQRVRASPRLLAAVGVVGVYAGYFGAGAGVMMLALLLFAGHDSLPNTNAVKNVALGLANGVAAVSFAVFGPVHWELVVPLGLGFLLGGRLGPIVVRRAPAAWLRIAIAVAGVGLSIKLGIDAYR